MVTLDLLCRRERRSRGCAENLCVFLLTSCSLRQKVLKQGFKYKEYVAAYIKLLIVFITSVANASAFSMVDASE